MASGSSNFIFNVPSSGEVTNDDDEQVHDSPLLESNSDEMQPQAGSTMNVPRNQQTRIMDIMNRLGYALAIVTFVLLIIFIPIYTVHAIRDRGVREDLAAFYSAGAFVILTVPISVFGIFMHMTHWYMPDVQKYVVRILWMVPLYSIQSWLSLRYHEFSLYIDTLRDLYEAFVIQSFLYFLVEILGGENCLAVTLRDKDESHGEHPKLIGYFVDTWQMGREFMLQCKHGVLQYVVIKTLATILGAILEYAGMYGEGVFDLTKGYVYLAFITNFSQMWALYVLVKLFYATKEDLMSPVNWHPVGKFLCVKGVVFFTWWQGLGIYMLQDRGLINDVGTWAADDVATALQDYLVCVEMLFFAIAHHVTFTYKEYMGNAEGADVGEDEFNSYDGEYRAPIIRTLQAPMSFSHAFWSSTVPKETLSDIRRLRHGASHITANQYEGIDMCVKNAESI
mmetsp:Transcript_46393/g.68503  ORF Transcript_46393/g.68503 Transcript_46393/m.68503 type:complete len:451 (+) Transcript_46393:292-1644(+)|eukprot:CAMPEP_0195524298 /NCGR_PEP_ID=MMETSP0794_2-20130614/24021_1 /TAXON_ID=515487 /ORGANISM="Stephanopyxis turris, Strain CCMP 815" /LENGTH=450 /DNA_ID=CAMNT_0040654481 /DNA_START=184 /DNA_END=1536 /DNA_ORIENTATION=+